MTIRSRLLILLVPTIIAFILLISIFFYINWYNEIISSASQLQSILILNPDGKLVGGIAGSDAVDQKLHDAIILIVLSAIIVISLVSISAYFIAGRISKPVHELNTAALAIAAGNYTDTIEVKGPHEIVELANTLNTMSECLQENILRLKENSFARERMYGEYECGLLLQHYMLEKVVQEFQSPELTLRLIKFTSIAFPHGLYLRIKNINEGETDLIFSEAYESGFQGIFNLLTHSPLLPPREFSAINLKILRHAGKVQYEAADMPAPIVWSNRNKDFVNDEDGSFNIQPQDLIFLYNHGFAKEFENRQKITELLGKVLRHFGDDNFDNCVEMINKELAYFTKKLTADYDLQALCVKLEGTEGT